MRQILLKIAYQGTNYHGWAKQENVLTIQETVETALANVVQIPLDVAGSSRTDSGVHALGQLAVFRTSSRIPAERFVPAINFYLPGDIRILQAREVSPNIDPLRTVVKKEYVYLMDDQPVFSPFLHKRVWSTGHGTLDVNRMHEAAQTLVGTHDFASFQSQGSPRNSTVRTIFRISVRRSDKEQPIPFFHPLVVLSIEGNGFLYNMIRIITGTLLWVGTGHRPVTWVREVLEAVDRSQAGPTVPPDGLYLKTIDIPDEIYSMTQ